MNTHTKTIIAVAGVCVGIVIGEKSAFGSEVAVASFLLFIFQLGIYFFSRRKLSDDEEESFHEKSRNGYDRKSNGSLVSLVSCLFFISLCGGLLRMQFVDTQEAVVCETTCIITARVIASPQTKDIYQVLDVELVPDNTQTNETGGGSLLRVRVRVPLYPEYFVGEVLTLEGKVSLPKSIYPHDGKKSFEYDVYLRLKKVGSEMYYPSVREVNQSTKKTFTEKLLSFERTLVSSIDTNISAPVSTLASGMLLGDRRMSAELTTTFRTAGLSHIVVLSGFNIVLLIGALFFITKFLPLLVRVGVVSVVIIIFVTMVGAEASIVRASMMSFVALLALVLGRGYIATQALLVSFFCIIVYSPESLLHDVSLHLSFLATAGIVYMSDGIKKLFEKYTTLSFFMKLGYQDIIATTVSAYVMTLPYVMYTFGSASLYALIANVLVLPLVPIVMLMTFMVVIFSSLSSVVTSLLGYLTTFLGGCIIWVGEMVEKLPYASVVVAINLTGMVLLYIAIIAVYVYVVTRKKDETMITNENEITSGIISY